MNVILPEGLPGLCLRLSIQKIRQASVATAAAPTDVRHQLPPQCEVFQPYVN
jgi:hypothetical protein